MHYQMTSCSANCTSYKSDISLLCLIINPIHVDVAIYQGVICLVLQQEVTLNNNVCYTSPTQLQAKRQVSIV